ncbi:MAG: terminase [Dehalococcoidia bacterium]
MTAVLDAPPLLGRAEPRLCTAPLRELTPETSLGAQAVRFAEEVCGLTLLPWQKVWLTRALELRPDGGLRFRTLVSTLPRQNGKSFLLKVLALYFMYVRGAPLILGTAQDLGIAREAWQGAVDIATDVDDLAVEVDRVRQANGEQEIRLVSGARYRISATTRSAGRGLSVDLLVLDEARHLDWDSWGALSKTTIARPDSLVVLISNAGDDTSVVLNSLRASALSGADEALGLLEWSAAPGCDLDDREAWAQANPSLGHTLSESALRAAMATDPAAVFRTECLNQQVDRLDTALDLAAWKASADPSGTLAPLRDRLAAVVDVSPDGSHVTLCGAAAVDDTRVRVEVLAAWDSVAQARRELAALLGKVKPRIVGWFPSGPAAQLGVTLRGLEAVELKGADVTECCQEFAALVSAGSILHPADPLLDAHVAGTSKLWAGDGWRFARRGGGHVDAAYACAGAVRLARTLPAPSMPRHRARVF